jgi:hypothetical protein
LARFLRDDPREIVGFVHSGRGWHFHSSQFFSDMAVWLFRLRQRRLAFASSRFSDRLLGADMNETIKAAKVLLAWAEGR